MTSWPMDRVPKTFYCEESRLVKHMKRAGHKDAEDKAWVKLTFHPEFASYRIIKTTCTCLDYLPSRMIANDLGLVPSVVEEYKTEVILRPYDRYTWYGKCRRCHTFYFAVKESQ